MAGPNRIPAAFFLFFVFFSFSFSCFLFCFISFSNLLQINPNKFLNSPKLLSNLLNQ
jgi:hypothetical protein